ncbi:MAG: hypothetical protein A2X08_00740 [Bacteroidetes bacterium GWA2_32_17]|nr:MAG: hypothetical protein A2X08_00740 [Bacteroidetes bacterium GWA2_32_17]
MIFIDNTQIAFASKTEKNLKKMCFFFKIILKGWAVSFSKILVKTALFINFPINWLVKPNVFKHFCEGENLYECIKTVKKVLPYLEFVRNICFLKIKSYDIIDRLYIISRADENKSIAGQTNNRVSIFKYSN